MSKTCVTCHEAKPLSEFYKRGDKAGYRPNCKVCFKKKERLRNNSDKEKVRVAAIKEKEAMERNPYGFLAAGIIELAIRERRNWKDGDKKMATDYVAADAMARARGFANPIEEIDAFFASDWFAELCDYCEVDAEYMRKIMLEEQDA